MALNLVDDVNYPLDEAFSTGFKEFSSDAANSWGMAIFKRP